MDTLEKIITQMHPDRYFHPKQLEFARHVEKIIEEDHDTDKVTVISGRPGCGNSTIILGIIQLCLEQDIGAVIATDSISRLEKFKEPYKVEELDNLDDIQRLYYKNKDKITLMTDENIKETSESQVYTPILLITTQRFDKISVGDIKDLFFKYIDATNNQHMRKYFIFDGAPTFYQRINFGISEINRLNTALHGGITNQCPQDIKDEILFQLEDFRKEYINIIDELEHKRECMTNLYWYDNSRHYIAEDGTDKFHVFDDDELFNKIFKMFSRDILKVDKDAELIKNMLFRLIGEGAFFTSEKIGANKKYSKTFYFLEDRTDKLLVDPKVKTFIFDGTAEIDRRYDKPELFNIIDCSECVVPMDHMTINVINVNSSNAALTNKAYMRKVINNQIKLWSLDNDDTVLVSYSNFIKNQTFEETGIGVNNMGYFGNLKGFNNWQDKHNFIQVGLNRFNESEYLMMQFYVHPEYYDYAKQRCKKSVESCIRLFDVVTGHGERSKPENDEMFDSQMADSFKDIMQAQISVDMIQNIYRCAARNYNVHEPITVYLFYDLDDMDKITAQLQREFQRLGAEFKEHDLPGRTIMKSRVRTSAGGNNANAKTQPQLFFDWLESVVDEEKEWKSKDIAESMGLTTEQLIGLKKYNSDVRKILADMKIPHKNLYKKSNLKKLWAICL